MARRKSSMTGAEFRALRLRSGSDVRTWAMEMDCTLQSIRNIENGSANIGRQMAQLARLVAYMLGERISIQKALDTITH